MRLRSGRYAEQAVGLTVPATAHAAFLHVISAAASSVTASAR